jgi:hypothetical protein
MGGVLTLNDRSGPQQVGSNLAAGGGRRRYDSGSAGAEAREATPGCGSRRGPESSGMVLNANPRRSGRYISPYVSELRNAAS